MRRTALLAAVACGLQIGSASGASSASAASVDLMVVGRSEVLKAPAQVRLKSRTVKAGGKRCAVGAATPLAALLGAGLPLGVRDYGSCGRSAGDGGGLFVRRVGPDSNRGQDGWVYKVGRKAGTAGAADLAGPFGDGRRLRSGQRVLWFWCVLSRADNCQPTLEISPASRAVGPGEVLRARVRGFDDFGRGTAVPGAVLTLGDARATSGADGFASITAPSQATGKLKLTAEKAGMVRAFPRTIVVE